MVKVILFLTLVFLVIRMVVRTLRKGLFIRRVDGFGTSGRSPASFSSAKPPEDADYEVLESHITDKERDVV